MTFKNHQYAVSNMAAKIISCDYRNGGKNDEDLKGLAMIWFDEIIWTWRKWISG